MSRCRHGMIGAMEHGLTVEESVVVGAEPEKVYAAVADPRRMGAWSPELFAVRILGGEVRQGRPVTVGAATVTASAA